MMWMTFKGFASVVVFMVAAIGVLMLLWCYLRNRRAPVLYENVPGPVPSVEAMLRIGKDLGYEKVEEAYDQYMHHWDCFFSIDRFADQYSAFIGEMSDLGLVSGRTVNDVTIDDALLRVEEASWK